MSSSTSAAVSALLDVVVVSAVVPERAEFELVPTPTPTPAAAIGFHRKVLTGSGMGRANAQLTIFLFTASIGLSIKSCDSFRHEEQLGQLPGVVVENLGSLRLRLSMQAAEFKTLPNQDTGVRRRVGEEYYVRYDEVI
ncbi:hypothetical protein JB92DRAFT_2832213 [Gautieria morchelliformis]|nr:hypothetical protein JB92DRAFT_2832211 [Gautieria morchelliformis]KAF8508849.1 hypothetical protein JB92DRAFT_2832213 [Gautieria morchelliformis]